MGLLPPELPLQPLNLVAFGFVFSPFLSWFCNEGRASNVRSNSLAKAASTWSINWRLCSTQCASSRILSATRLRILDAAATSSSNVGIVAATHTSVALLATIRLEPEHPCESKSASHQRSALTMSALSNMNGSSTRCIAAMFSCWQQHKVYGRQLFLLITHTT